MIFRQINLDFRVDRWEECVANHLMAGFSPKDALRVSACYEKGLGALGCAKSHIRALCDFYTLGNEEFAVILEDDFDFTVSKREFEEKLQFIKRSGLKWDVLMLAGTSVIGYGSEINFLEKLFEANTTSGYIVQRSYVPKLMACFLEASQNLHKYRNVKPNDVMRERFSIDIAWKALQRRDDWFLFSPRLGIQRPSFSDIENQAVDYKERFSK